MDKEQRSLPWAEDKTSVMNCLCLLRDGDKATSEQNTWTEILSTNKIALETGYA